MPSFILPMLGALAVVLAATVTGWFAWRISKHSSSGSIGSSTAQSLWDAGNDLRVLMAAERVELTKEVSALKNEIRELKVDLRESIASTVALNREIRQSRDETALAREETRLSRAETRELMAQIDALHLETKDVLNETKDVLHEVKTSNALTMGQLADNSESRRIDAIPKGDRTTQEQEHLRSASERLPDALRAKVDDDQTDGDGS